MIVIEDGCVDCGLPCIYEACPHYKVIRYYCDKCGDDNDLYYWDGYQLCADCVLDQLEKIEYEEF